MLEWLQAALAPAQTAVLVVDVQYDFCALDGRFAQNGMEVSAARRMLAPLTTLLSAARAVGARPVYLRFVEDPDGHVVSEAYDRQRYRAGDECRYCIDERGRAIVPEVAPRAAEPVIDKVRASGFFNTALDTVLRCAGMRTIVLTGMATDSCVLATAIDATARDYYVVIALDCVASFSAERHEAAMQLLTFKHPAATSAEICALWLKTREEP